MVSTWMFVSSFGGTLSLSLFIISLSDFMEMGGKKHLDALSPNIYYIQGYLLGFLLFTIKMKPDLM
jgi:hypothetical protein